MPMLFVSVEAWPRIRAHIPPGFRVRLRFQVPLLEIHYD